MSWMDSWSRPTKSQHTPAPYYLLPGGEATPYCHSCGRVISSRRSNAADTAKSSSSNAAPVKYCSSRCRNSKPRQLDRQIEATFVRLLQGEEAEVGTEGDPPPKSDDADRTDNGRQATKEIEARRTTQKKSKNKKNERAKGDPRILVSCDEVETAVFGERRDPTKVYGRKKNRASRALSEAGGDEEEEDKDHEKRSVEYAEAWDVDEEESSSSTIDGDVLARLSVRSGTRIRPAQTVSEVNGSVGGEKGWAERQEETEEMARKRAEGLRRAREKEMVKCAARRLVVFGHDGPVDAGDAGRRKCEAVMRGKVVEPSYAKGNWAIRWRE